LELSALHLQYATAFYNGSIQKNAAAILAGTMPIPPVIHPAVLGNVHPTFIGMNYNLTLEYFWGLTSSPAYGSVVTNVLIQNFANGFGEFEDRCWFKAILQWSNSTGGINNYTIVNQMRFDSKTNKIIEFEIFVIDEVLFTRQGGLDVRVPAQKTAAIAGTCELIQSSCYGPNLQYENQTACVAFMDSIPYNDEGLLLTSTVECRELHAHIASISYDFAIIHCPHAGVTGGGRCIEVTNIEEHTPLFNEAPRLIY